MEAEVDADACLLLHEIPESELYSFTRKWEIIFLPINSHNVENVLNVTIGTREQHNKSSELMNFNEFLQGFLIS